MTDPTTRRVRKRRQIWESLRDPEYRHTFVAGGIRVGLAFQIRALRTKHKLTKRQLAAQVLEDELRYKAVATWESPDCGIYDIGVLIKLAKAFDVALEVRFIPFSKAAEGLASLTQQDIAPPSFEEEILNDQSNQ